MCGKVWSEQIHFADLAAGREGRPIPTLQDHIGGPAPTTETKVTDLLIRIEVQERTIASYSIGLAQAKGKRHGE
jgi:hypothetical protein